MQLSSDSTTGIGEARVARTSLAWRARVAARAAAIGRVIGFLSLVWIVASIGAAGMVRADLDEAMLGFGAEMMRLDRARQQSEPAPLTINGARVSVSSGMSDASVDEVLDEVEARCRARDSHLGAQLEPGGEHGAVLAAEAGIENAGVLDSTLRESDGERGYVACLDMGPDDVGPEEILARVERFLESGDISDIGHLRYAFAERAGEGSHFVAYWSDGPLNVGEMFPSTGDAPGEDVEGVARPPSSRRILSARADGEPYGLTVYGDSPLSATQLEAFHRRSLLEAGFVLRDIDGDTDGETVVAAYEVEGGRGLVAERDGRLVLVVIGSDPEDRGTVEIVEIAELL
jgi:hypothetical protein